jgi:predicted ABC-type ATPase
MPRAQSSHARAPCIYVLAGTNGAGKSSIAGAMLQSAGTEYFNPDEAAKRILVANPIIALEEANAAAWNEGRRLLERAISEKGSFAFETTLGGQTIAALLEKAALAGIDVKIWYVGLESPELHIARVRSRVEKGGHDIPEGKIRERYANSRFNLIRLLPKLTELLVYDNSEEADPQAGLAPRPKLIIHIVKQKIVAMCDLIAAPTWAKPILIAAMKCCGRFK